MAKEAEITILIAEDDSASRQLLAAGLRQGGLAVIETENGEEAVRQAMELQPDLIILDVMMPVMSGIEAAKIIRRESDIPFIFLSALDQEDLVRQAVAEGAMGYLVKPFNVAQLVPTVKAALSRAEELGRLRVAESNLSAALSLSRETSIAVGILMERHGLTQEAAFASLRAAARQQRRKVAEVAVAVVEASDSLNRFAFGNAAGADEQAVRASEPRKVSSVKSA